MRIGILTLPLNTNYGGILQAWALQTVLERMGHEVKVIHKNPYLKEPSLWEYLCRYYKKKVLGKQLFVKAEKWHNQVTPILRKNIEMFIAKHIHSYTIDTLQQIEENDFDVIVVGSDQIWRKKYFIESWGNDEANAFLEFAEKWKIKRIAYAASFGTDEWEFSERYSSDISRLIKKFNAVSVREKSGVEICKKYLNVEALHLLDPTMLFNSKDYQELLKDSDLPSQSNSLFCYILDDSKEKQDIINRIAATKKLTPRQMFFPTEYADATQCKPFPPVEQFIQGIMNANFVITDSFHGSVFSIIFNKPFVAINNSSRGSTRLSSLLTMFGLEKKLIETSTMLTQDIINLSVDYKEVDELLDELRKSSFTFLETYLENTQ